MKKILSILTLFLPAFFAGAQLAYVLPSPTDAEAEVTLYIDVSQSTSNGLKAMLTEHPDDDVYLWSWMPAEPVVGNGQWGESNDALLMTKESPFLYSITFIPTEFYGVEGAEFFTEGISCLAKLKNGNEYADLEVGEAKTEDVSVDIVPKLCDNIICVFPEIRRQDDFLSITYDNNQETLVPLQNIPENEVFVFVRAFFTGGGAVNYASPADSPNFPELQLKPVSGEPGKFRITFIPQDLFSELMTPDQTIDRLLIYIVRAGVGSGGVPNQVQIPFLLCE